LLFIAIFNRFNAFKPGQVGKSLPKVAYKKTVKHGLFVDIPLLNITERKR